MLLKKNKLECVDQYTAVNREKEKKNQEIEERDAYENSPEVDDDKESEIELLMKGEYENEKVVGDGLKIAVERVESVRGKRCWNYKSRDVNQPEIRPRSH